MQNPERWRNAALACFLAGPVTVFTAFVLPESAGKLRGMLVILGLMGMLFGGLGALVFQQAVKKRRRLTPQDAAVRELQASIANAGQGAVAGDPSDPESLATCWKCGFQTYAVTMVCERCGANMMTRRGARRAGALLVVLGSLLAAGMLFALVMETPILTHPGQEIDGQRFDGSPGMALFALSLFSGIAVFGFICLGYGIFQIRTGRRSKLIVRIMMAVAGGFMILGFLARNGFLK